MSPVPGRRGLQRMGRAREIGYALARHGFDDVLTHFGMTPPRLGRTGPVAASTFERIRHLLEDLGPTFIKFGQVLSVRPDLIPEGLMFELRKLQREVTPLPFEELEPVLSQGLGEDWRELLPELDPEPLASASLAQVHAGRLADGTAVAVKILKPGIERTIATDLDMLRHLASLLDGHLDVLESYDLPGMADELSTMLQRELNLERELKNMRTARVNMRDMERIFVPRVHPEASCRQVLTMDLVDGRHLDDLPDLPDDERRTIARAGLRATLKQVLEDGFFHADPHPGNLLLCDDGSVALLDWGMTGRLTRTMRRRLVDLVWALADGDSEQATQVLRQIAGPGGPADEAMERDLLEVMDLMVGVSLANVSLGEVLLAMTRLLRRHGLRVPSDLAVMVKAKITAEGTARMLYPSLDVFAEARPIIRRITMRRKSLLAVAKALGDAVSGFARLQKTLPARMDRILLALEEGRLRIGFKHENLDGLRSTLERASNRLALAVVLAAIFLGSSLIMTTGMHPLLFGYPAFGVLGYVISGCLGVWLAINILRGRRF